LNILNSSLRYRYKNLPKILANKLYINYLFVDLYILIYCEFRALQHSKMKFNTFYSSVSLQTLALLALFVAPNLGAQDCNVGEQLQVAVGYRPEPARLSGTLSLQAMNALYTTAAPEQSRPVAGEPHSQSPRPTEAPEVNNTTPVSGTPALKKKPPVYGLNSLATPCGSCSCLGFCPFQKCVGVCL